MIPLDQYYTPEEAAELGYRQLTSHYTLPDERAMIQGVMDDLDRVGTPYLLVGHSLKAEVWRTKEGWVSEDNPLEDEKEFDWV